jgi:hypothetical protein
MQQGCDPESTGRWLGDNINNPSIVNSVTNDEDEDDHFGRSDTRNQTHSLPPLRSSWPSPPHAAGNSHIRRSKLHVLKSVQSSYLSTPSFDAESFLVRYERMIKEQETEKMVTFSHLQPILELLDNLTKDGHGRDRNSSQDQYTDNRATDVNGIDSFSKEFSYDDLQLALSIIDDVANASVYRVVKTDEQFMMVLRLLCETGWNASDTSGDSSQQDTQQMRISWAEILQCYRCCIVGMQTLEILSSPSPARARAKERTLRILSTFQPVSASFLDGPPTSSRANADSICHREKPLWIIDQNTPTSTFTNTEPRGSNTGLTESSRHGWSNLVKLFVLGATLVCVTVLIISTVPSTFDTLEREDATKMPITRTTATIVPSDLVGFPGDMMSRPRMNDVLSWESQSYLSEKAVDIPPSAPKMNSSPPVLRRSDVRLVQHVKSARSNSMPSIKSLLSTPIEIRSIPPGNFHHAPVNAWTTVESTVKETEEIDKRKQIHVVSRNLGGVGVVGGCAAIAYFLLPLIPGGAAAAVLNWIPTGLTVLISTMIGNKNFRDWVASKWLRLRRKQFNKTSNLR